MLCIHLSCRKNLVAFRSSRMMMSWRMNMLNMDPEWLAPVWNPGSPPLHPIRRPIGGTMRLNGWWVYSVVNNRGEERKGRKDWQRRHQSLDASLLLLEMGLAQPCGLICRSIRRRRSSTLKERARVHETTWNLPPSRPLTWFYASAASLSIERLNLKPTFTSQFSGNHSKAWLLTVTKFNIIPSYYWVSAVIRGRVCESWTGHISFASAPEVGEFSPQTASRATETE